MASKTIRINHVEADIFIIYKINPVEISVDDVLFDEEDILPF